MAYRLYRCTCCEAFSLDAARRGFMKGLALTSLAALSATLLARRDAAAQPRRAPRTAPHTPNYIIRNACVVTMDPDILDLPRGDVHVKDGRIAAVLPRIEDSSAEIVDAAEMIVMPGFVETHWHLWNSTLKNMMREGVEYFPLKAAFVKLFTPADHYAANRLALCEAVNAGMTSVHNFAHNTRSPAHVDMELKALSESGLSGRYSYGWSDPTPDGDIFPATDIRRVQKAWFGNGSAFDGKVDLGLAVRGPMYTAREVYEPEIRAGRDIGVPLVMHIGQTRRRYSPCAVLLQQGLLDKTDILVHGETQSMADLDAIAKVGASVSLSMESELRDQEDGDVRAEIFECLRRQINVCLSIDADPLGVPSMFDNMRYVFNIGLPWHKTPSEGMPPVSHDAVLKMATINGARALGRAALTGSLTPGKRADILMVRADDLNMVPLGESTTTLVRSAANANVDTVIAQGKMLKFAGELVGIDLDDVKADAAGSLFDLRTKAGGAWAPKGPDKPRF